MSSAHLPDREDWQPWHLWFGCPFFLSLLLVMPELMLPFRHCDFFIYVLAYPCDQPVSPPLILGPGPLPALFHPPPVAPPDWASSSDVDNSSVKGILRGWNNRVQEYALMEYTVNSRLRSTGARPSSSLSPEFFVQSLDKLIFIW